jgi:hypothetical protein
VLMAAKEVASFYYLNQSSVWRVDVCQNASKSAAPATRPVLANSGTFGLRRGQAKSRLIEVLSSLHPDLKGEAS